MINSFSNFLSGNYLFNRAYELAIGAPNQTSALKYGNIDAKNPSPLRVSFEIDKFSLNTSNKAKISVYNLTQAHRQAIKRGFLITLKAGYKTVYDQLFVGNILPLGLGSERHEADIVTTFECGDGESSIILANLDKSYPAGVSKFSIVQDCAKAMHLENDTNPDGVNAGITLGVLNSGVYNTGFTVRGSVADTLSKVLTPLGLEWSIQNGAINIIPKTGHNGQTAIVVSTETGMIGVPSQDGDMMKFSSLLNPQLVPGALVNVKSKNTDVNGYYRIRKSHFEGDTHENNKWNVNCECVTMPNVVQSLVNTNLLQGTIS